MRRIPRLGLTAWAVAAMVFSFSGCTSYRDYINNGFKVGPNYCPPKAPVAQHWIDASDKSVREKSEDLSKWWTVFNDATLNGLIANAYHQNLTLKEAGFRILEARAQLGIARGELFPQLQDATGGYLRSSHPTGAATPPIFSDSWNYAFNLQWELDFWGRFRRAVTAADDQLQASVEGYDGVLITLLGDVATNYVQVRQYQEQIELAKSNVELQRGVLKIVQARLDAGRTSELDVDQAQSTLSQTEAQIPLFKSLMRQAQNRLCTLLGMPPVDLAQRIGNAAIPTAPPEVVVGIPADLLTRRPDVRQAERLAAAQCEEIGIAKSDFYPHIAITGSLGYQAQNFKDLFKTTALNSSVGPQFQWNLLNYGRILNNVRLQDARFQELVVTYQQTVLNASEEAEDGVVTFLQAHDRARLLAESVVAAQKAVNIVVNQYRVGTVDFNRVATIEQSLVQVQDLQAQSRGQIAIGLITAYRALGGGWQIRLTEGDATSPIAPDMAPAPAAAPAVHAPIPLPAAPGILEELPAPKPVTEEPKDKEKDKEKATPSPKAGAKASSSKSDTPSDAEAKTEKKDDSASKKSDEVTTRKKDLAQALKALGG